MRWFRVGDGCYTAGGVRSRIIPGTRSTQNSSKSQLSEEAETAQNRRQFWEDLLILLHLGTESENMDGVLSYSI